MKYYLELCFKLALLATLVYLLNIVYPMIIAQHKLNSEMADELSVWCYSKPGATTTITSSTSLMEPHKVECSYFTPLPKKNPHKIY